jgi:hypothetical protein
MAKKRARRSKPAPSPARARLVTRLVVAAAALGVLGWFARGLFAKKPVAEDAVVDAAAVEDDPTLTTKNGLVSVRYPSGYTPTQLDDATIELDDEFLSLTIGAVYHPAIEEPGALADRILGLLRAKLGAEGATFDERSRKPAQCLGKYPGVETDEIVNAPGAMATHLRGCFFVHEHRAISVTWLLPDEKAAREKRALDRILGSVELHEPVVPKWDEATTTTLPNGLITTHHPALYAVKIKDEQTLTLRAPDRSSITFSARALTKTLDAAAAERAFWESVKAAPDGVQYREDERSPGDCFAKQRGTVVKGVLLADGLPAFTVRSCFFVLGPRAFAMTLTTPVGDPTAAAAAERVLAATEINAP